MVRTRGENCQWKQSLRASAIDGICLTDEWRRRRHHSNSARCLSVRSKLQTFFLQTCLQIHTMSMSAPFHLREMWSETWCRTTSPRRPNLCQKHNLNSRAPAPPVSTSAEEAENSASSPEMHMSNMCVKHQVLINRRLSEIRAFGL